MAEMLSEEEQVEAIKQWLKKNGPGIAAGIVIGLSAIGGWRWWQDAQDKVIYTASAYYDTMMQAVEADDMPKARGQATVLTNSYAETSYGVFAGLMQAKLDADAGDNGKAIEWLQWVLNHTEQRDLIDITRLRLARIMIAEKQLDTAEGELDRILSATFSGEQQALKGDIYIARNEIDKARSAYQAALAATGNADPIIQLKLDNLPSTN